MASLLFCSLLLDNFVLDPIKRVAYLAVAATNSVGCVTLCGGGFTTAGINAIIDKVIFVLLLIEFTDEFVRYSILRPMFDWWLLIRSVQRVGE
jgi:hypothetical protein